RVVISDFGCPIERLERLLFITGSERDFTKAFVGVEVARIKRDGSIGIVDGLVSASKIFCRDECQLQQRSGSVRVCFNRVFQNIDRLWKIILSRKQRRDSG